MQRPQNFCHKHSSGIGAASCFSFDVKEILRGRRKGSRYGRVQHVGEFRCCKQSCPTVGVMAEGHVGKSERVL